MLGSRLIPLVLISGVTLGFLACGGDQVELTELLDSGAQPLPVEEVEASGSRDGDVTQAQFTLRGAGGLEMVLDLEIGYDPQPILRGGTWTYQGPTGDATGTVEAEAVLFAGGQGQGVNVGGVYVLEEDGRPRFRVDLPMTAVQAPDWTP